MQYDHRAFIRGRVRNPGAAGFQFFGQLPGRAIARAVQPHACDADLRRRRLFRLDLPVVLITVKPAPGLASEQARGHPGRDQRRGAIHGFLQELVVNGLHHLAGHVQPGQVQQFKRPHPEPQGLAHDPVHVNGLRHALFQDTQGFRGKAAAGMVHQETGLVRGDHGAVAGGSNQG